MAFIAIQIASAAQGIAILKISAALILGVALMIVHLMVMADVILKNGGGNAAILIAILVWILEMGLAQQAKCV